MFFTFSNTFRGTEEQKHHLHESPGLITFPLIVLAILATIGGLISLPGHSWLNHFFPIFSKLASEEHAFRNDRIYVNGNCLNWWLLGIVIALVKYIKQNTVPEEDAKSQV
jgi:NADH-quinone oxidoreductase subunit L